MRREGAAMNFFLYEVALIKNGSIFEGKAYLRYAYFLISYRRGLLKRNLISERADQIKCSLQKQLIEEGVI